MTVTIPHFSEMPVVEPDMADLQARHDALYARFDGATSTADRVAVVRDWEQLRRDVDTWGSLVSLRFYQDTTDPERKAARERLDELSPAITQLGNELKKRLLACDDRAGLAAQLGEHVFNLWACDTRTFDESIKDDLVEESRLTARYVELRSSAKLEFRGETLNLSSIGRYLSDPDRQTRYEANRVRWQFFADHAEEFDALYDKLVRLRTAIARKLGYPSFVELAYDRMSRTDYGRADVEGFRDEIRRVLVPLTVELKRRQAERLGVDRLMSWDEPVQDPQGNPKPHGDSAWMVERATAMFDAMHPELGAFFRMMNDRGLLDLDTRDGKAGGGFCTSMPSWGVPFIFANFNGTRGDATVFTHEMGHAFQFWSSREQPLHDYLWPTYEACEIHSMSLEYLTFPWMEQFFEGEAERFRFLHLVENLQFLPYGAAVDEFQHAVYDQPELTPAERRALWTSIEARYLPGRDYGDLPHVGDGGLWQGQSHIYEVPFYYIDYTLAEACALQFWVHSREDFDAALERYVALCRRGGSLPFRQLTESAGLIPPFQRGSLEAVVEHVRRELDL